MKLENEVVTENQNETIDEVNNQYHEELLKNQEVESIVENTSDDKEVSFSEEAIRSSDKEEVSGDLKEFGVDIDEPDLFNSENQIVVGGHMSVLQKSIEAFKKKGAKFTSLDGIERELTDSDLMICSGDKPLCMAGIFGGLNSGVNTSTKSIFLESAYFDPISIRKSAKYHGLNTDASYQFLEH